MIAFLRGTVAAKSATDAVIDVGGVGYVAAMTTASLGAIGSVGEMATIYTYMQVSDAGISLFGFAAQSELDAFKLLIGVNGVGPKMAIAVLSVYSPEVLAAAISSEDTTALSRVSGVGKKTASRIILELKDKFKAPSAANLFEGVAGAVSATVATSALAGATEALFAMGFTAAETELALKGAPETSEGAALQYALKRLGS
jgi:Holliday junction DNA helicase RuvA